VAQKFFRDTIYRNQILGSSLRRMQSKEGKNRYNASKKLWNDFKYPKLVPCIRNGRGEGKDLPKPLKSKLELGALPNMPHLRRFLRWNPEG
jgi:hypothetical protein